MSMWSDEQEFQRRLGDEIFVLGVELVVDDGDAAPIGDDLEPGGLSVFEQHAARTLDRELPLRALAVRPDLDEVGGHHARRVKPGVGALDRVGRRKVGGRAALRRLRRFRRRERLLRLDRRVLGVGGGSERKPEPERQPPTSFRHHVRPFALAPAQRPNRAGCGKYRFRSDGAAIGGPVCFFCDAFATGGSLNFCSRPLLPSKVLPMDGRNAQTPVVARTARRAA